MKSLVIGSRGLVGSALFRTLQGSSEIFEPEVRIRWNSTHEVTTDLMLLLSEFFRFVEGEQWAIFWAAGKGHLGSTHEEMHVEEAMFSVVCKWISECQNAKGLIVFVSSAGAIWAGSSIGQVSERTPPSGLTPYATSKLRQESQVAELCQGTGIRGLNLRLGSVYGESQDLQKPQGLISRLCVASVMRRSVEIFVPLETTRNYIYANDAAKMIASAAHQAIRDSGPSGEATMRIICSRDNHSIASVCKFVEVVAHRKLRISCKMTENSQRYPLHFQLTSEHADELMKFESTTLLAGISSVHSAMVHALQDGVLIDHA